MVQRVSRAEVRLAAEPTVLGRIDRGIVVLVGIGQGDTAADAAFLVDKIANLRIFPDPPGTEGAARGNMNRSLHEVDGGLLVISQFTLFGDCRKGRRPSFTSALSPTEAEALYEVFVDLCRRTGRPVATGRFGAMMHVELVNDGPVTLLLDSREGAAVAR